MPLTVGIEQEFFVVHADTARCVRQLPQEFYDSARRALGDGVTRELLSSMIELVTQPHKLVDGAITELRSQRRELGLMAQRHELALMACGAHPFSDWRAQELSEGARPQSVLENMAGLTRRAHVCGIHVHVGVDSNDERIDIFNRVQPLLPILASISASSPIWRGELMGVESYRMVAYSEGPRTGLPGRFSGYEQYVAVAESWRKAGFVEDKSYFWWWLRPSHKHPTLELRVADSCAEMDRIAFLAAFFRSAVAYLVENPMACSGWEPHHDALLRENLWQAARFGLEAVQIDLESGHPELLHTQLARWLERIRPFAARLGDLTALEGVNSIAKRQTEAAAIRELYEKARLSGHAPHEAARIAAQVIVKRTARASGRKLSATAA